MTTTPAPMQDPYAALRYRDFSLFLLARLIVTIALQMQTLAISWRVYELTQDSFALGLVGLSEAIPAIAISLYAGYKIDHSDKRTSLLWVFTAFIATTILFGYFTSPKLLTHLSNHQIVLCVYLSIFLWGIARGFSMPASFSLMSRLIPTELAANAASWSSTTWQIGAIAGPILGGFLYHRLGVSTLFAISFGLLLGAWTCIWALKPQPPRHSHSKEPIGESIANGLRFVTHNPVILGALSLDLFSVLFGGVTALLPVFADTILKVGAEGLGFMRSAPSIGAALMLVFLTYFPPLKHSGYKLLGAVAMFGFCTILFAFSKNYYWSIILLALTGAFDAVSVQLRHTILQMTVPDEMRGRVSSVNTIFISSSNEIGAFESGVAARLMGTIPSVVFGGTMTILIVLGTYFKVPALRNFSIHK